MIVLLRRLRQLADHVILVVTGALLLILLATVMLGVVSRALDEPFIWTDEVSRFEMVWLATLGWCVACRMRGHIRVRFFRDLLPRRAWRVAETLMQLAVASFGVLVTVHGAGLVSRNIDLEATTVPVSMAVIYAPICLAGLVTTVQALSEVYQLLAGAPRPIEGGEALSS